MAINFSRSDFPEGFVFGTATAAYQIEGSAYGQCGPSHWDTFAATPGNVANGESGSIACDHFHRFEQDLDLVQACGFDSYRFSTSWARIMPDGRNINEEGLDLVSGWKKTRHDNLFLKNIPSKLFNFAARLVSGIKLHDFNCGIKVYTKNVVKTIDVSGEMHRYIPFLASQAGFKNISEKEVKHQSRKYGITKFGPERFLNGFLDLLTLWFLNQFGKRPMHFFGLLGNIMFFVGFGFTLYLGIDKLFFNINSRLITDRPEFFIALVTIIIGVQFFIAGFIGELLVRQKPSQNNYLISQTTLNE